MANDYRTQDVLYKKNAKLKRIYQVFSDNHSELFSEYEYDKSGRISKTFLGDSVITENTYKEKLLVYSITFEGEKSNFIHDSKKVYDMNG